MDPIFEGSWLQYGTDSDGVSFVEYQQGSSVEKREWFLTEKDMRVFALQMAMYLHCKPVNCTANAMPKTTAERDAEIVSKHQSGISFADIKLEYSLSCASIYRILRKAKSRLPGCLKPESVV